MKCTLVILTTGFTTLGLIGQATAQIRTPTQEFFEQGLQQVEREIQLLQGERSVTEENHQQQPKSKPLLEINPASSDAPSQQPSEIENLNPTLTPISQ